MGTMEVMHAINAVDSSPSLDIRNLGPAVHAAQMQYQRQLKNLQAIQRQFEQTAEANAAWRERERRREEKYSHINQERLAQRDNLTEYTNRMAEKRAERLEAANRNEAALRAAAQARVQAVEDRLARFAEARADHIASERQRIAALEARRDATYRQNLELLEERRQAILAHERKVEDLQRQREELRQLQAQIKAEEDFLREQQRRANKARAEDGLAERVAHFHAKNTAKDEQLARRKKGIEEQRRMRAEELRQRFEYIAAQAHEAAALAEAERQMLADKLEDKAARSEALATKRAALLAEMHNLRHQMQLQEEHLRGSLIRMQQLGSAAVPGDVVRTLEGVQWGAPLATTAVLGGGRAAQSHLTLEAVAFPSEGGARRDQVEGAVSVGLRSAAAGPLRGRRPKSAGPTPRGPRGLSPSAGGSHSARNQGSDYIPVAGGHEGAMHHNPRVMSGPGGKGSQHVATIRPDSAGAGPPGGTASVVGSPVGAAAAWTSSSVGPVPYAKYTLPITRPRSGLHRRPTLEEEVAAAVDTSTPAAEAIDSGRYSGVHEVARPGSRREEELRVVLQEEIAKESERQSLLSKVTDDDERARLIKFFTLEREEARRRILALSSAAQAALYH